MTAQCTICGQTWPRHPALAVPCPTCKAKVGQHCCRPSGHRGPAIQPHRAREQAALDAGLLHVCPGPPGSPAPATDQAEGKTSAREQLTLW